jgi:isopentenyldiphosphate isomerase
LLKLNLEINDFKLQKEEVAEVKWVTYDEFKKLFYSKDFV